MIYFAYITTSDRAEAQAIGRAMVDQQLAACANIINGMESIYWWDGKIESAKEAILILKTDFLHKEALTKAVKEMHSYDCPCILFFAADRVDGNPDYMQWIQAQLKKDK